MTTTAQARVAFRSIYAFHFGGEPTAEHMTNLVESLPTDYSMGQLTDGLGVLMALAQAGVDLTKLLDEMFHCIQLDPSGETDGPIRAIVVKHLGKVN